MLNTNIKCNVNIGLKFRLWINISTELIQVLIKFIIRRIYFMIPMAANTFQSLGNKASAAVFYN